MITKKENYSPKWYQDVFRWFYSFVLVLLIPIAFANLIRRGSVRQKDYNYRRFERFGFVTPAPKKQGYLFHCVSVGEVVAASCLIKQILQFEPGTQVTVTTTTPTGSARVRSIFGDRVHHFYLPYDLHMAMAGMLKRIQPKMVMITEVELWPNFIHACWKRNVPVMVINARMTDRSAKRYKKVPILFAPMLAKLSHVCAQGQRDFDNYRFLGMPDTKLTLTNNIKFDQASALEAKSAPFLKLNHSRRKVLVGGSTHAPEEQVLIDAYKKLKPNNTDLLLVLVPRHPERFETVAKLVQKNGLKMLKSREVTQVSANCDVLLVNEMGKLNLVYDAADFAFVGGSLADKGGHNALEPAAKRLPILMGPHTYNNPVICSTLIVAGALVKIENSEQLISVVENWLAHPEQANAAGESGYQELKRNSGALTKTLAAVASFVEDIR